MEVKPPGRCGWRSGGPALGGGCVYQILALGFLGASLFLNCQDLPRRYLEKHHIITHLSSHRFSPTLLHLLGPYDPDVQT